MFNFCRRSCGCDKHQHDSCRPQRPDCRPQRPDCKPDFKPDCKPVCHPVCFNVIVKKEHKCKEFDGCNSYPDPCHDDKDEFEMFCCCCCD